MLSKKQFAQLLRGLPADVPDVVVHLAAQAAEEGHPLEHISQLVHSGGGQAALPTPQTSTEPPDLTGGAAPPKDLASHGAHLIQQGVTPENWTKLMLGSGVPKEHLGKMRAASEKLIRVHKA